MPTSHPNIFGELAAPFRPNELKEKTETSKKTGKSRTCTYITARTVMNRLDTVVGPENWWDTYCPAGQNSVACALTIRLPDGTIVTKCDAGGNAGMADSGDDDKSGYSDAFKRAAVKFGVGRYLYRNGVPHFAHSFLGANGPDDVGAQAPPSSPGPPAEGRGKWGDGKPPSGDRPSTGKAFFCWASQQGKSSGHDVVKYLGLWGSKRGHPDKIVQWTEEQVSRGFEAACRRLDALSQPEHASQEAD